MAVDSGGLGKNRTVWPIRVRLTQHLHEVNGPTVWVALQWADGKWGTGGLFCGVKGQTVCFWYLCNMLDKDVCCLLGAEAQSKG